MIALRLPALALLAAAGAAAPAPPCPEVPDLQLLQALRQRRAEQDVREAALTAQAAALAGKAQGFVQRLAALDREVARLESALGLGDAARSAREKRIAQLLATLENLTARKAAPLLSETDADLAAELLMRMEPARSAALLALIPPAHAGKLVDEVGAKRRAAKSDEAAPAAKRTP